MPPDLVIRPPGVWDARAPFHIYLGRFKKIDRLHALGILSALSTERDLRDLPKGSDKSTLFHLGQGHHAETGKRRDSVRKTAWKKYQRAQTPRGKTPSNQRLATDINQLLRQLHNAGIIEHVALFESHLHCWLLNMLAAKLEVGQLWTNEERYLAQGLSPAHGSGALPNISTTIRSIRELRSGLNGVPLYDDYDMSILEAVRFWVAVRNVLVHQAGKITPNFMDRNGRTFQKMVEQNAFKSVRKVGRTIFISTHTVSQAAFTFCNAANWMAGRLITLSLERRGHPFAPASYRPPPIPVGDIPQRTASMFIRGDHEYSHLWATDQQWRDEFTSDVSQS